MAGFFAVLAGAIMTLGVHAQQQPFVIPDSQADVITNVSTGNFIFNSLAGLLKQLPNAIHPNGHTIIPAIIRAYTPLYHAYPAIRDEPCRTEWLAFDPEMSFAISQYSLHVLTSK
jgi:hypothetical protein